MVITACVVGGGATVVVIGAAVVVGGAAVLVVGGAVVVVGGAVVVVVVRVVVGVVVVVVVVVGVVVVVVVGVVVVVVVVGVVVVVVAELDAVVVLGDGVTVVTVGSPLLPVTVMVCGTATAEVVGGSPGFVTRVVVVVGVLSLLVRVTARPPTATAATVAAIPKSRGGLRYHGSGGATRTVAVSPCPKSPGPNSTADRSPVGEAPW